MQSRSRPLLALLFLPCLAAGAPTAPGADPAARFRRGDANADGRLDLSDAIFTLDYLYNGKAPPPCMDAGDSNDDGLLNLSDAVYTLKSLVSGGAPPRPPFPGCGPDPTSDALDCLAFEAAPSRPCLDGPDAVETFEETLHLLANQARASNGLPPLKHNALLARAMRLHLEDMAVNDYFGHVSLDGSLLTDRVEAAGYTPWTSLGENIAGGYLKPETVIAGWMGSPTHRANILSTRFREMGAAHVYGAGSPYQHYWGQDFGAQPDVYPVVIDLDAATTSSGSVALYVYGAGWALEMQVSNDAAFTGAAWRPFQSSLSWTLPPGAGPKTVYVRLRSGSTIRSAQDTIRLVE